MVGFDLPRSISDTAPARGFTMIRSHFSRLDRMTIMRNEPFTGVDIRSTIPSSSASVSDQPDTVMIAYGALPIRDTISRGLYDMPPSGAVVYEPSEMPLDDVKDTDPLAIGQSSITPDA